jgi:hypothetical protein
MTTDKVSVQTEAEQGSPQPQNVSAMEQNVQEQKLDEARVIELATEIASRTAQSLVDKAEYRISQRAQDQIEALELNQDVLGLSDQQVQEAKQKIVMHELTAKPQEKPPSNPPVSQVQTAEEAIAAFVNEIFADEGTHVTPSDPEWKNLQAVIDATYNDPKGMIKVTRAAINASAEKAKRVNSNSESAAARVIGSGGGQTTTLDGPEVTGHSLFVRARQK